MNDLEFRKKATIAPGEQNQEFLDKINQNPHNRRFVDEQLTFDKKLRDGLSIATPENLSQRIILSQQLAQFKSQRRERRDWFIGGLAASLLAVIISASLLLPRSIDGEQLARQVINHIIQDTHALNVQMAVPKNSIDSMLASYGGKLDGPIGQVTFLGHCIIGSQTGIHMVLHSSDGKITVMLLPSQTIEHTHTLNDRHFSGLLYPGKKGSIAIVADHAKAIQQTRRKLEHNLNWII